MSIKNFTDYSLPQNSYVAFDATTLKELIIERLNKNEVFRDQSFEGSNLNAFIDIVAYMYHVLLFYLNTTSSETSFTTATLYENINKLVSNLGYKPIGQQTSTANITLTGLATLPVNNYTLKRFSTVFAEGLGYTAIKDISFEKTTADIAEILSVDYNLLHQGIPIEHPQYTAIGEDYETITVVNISNEVESTAFISDNTFSIFIKDLATGKWSEWTETSSIFLGSYDSLIYEKRLNENGNFEFKFGNGINGKKLATGDIVQIYYVRSDGERGIISRNILRNNFFGIYNTPRFNEISADVYGSTVNLLQGSNLVRILVNNDTDSTPISQAETVEQIKENASKLFSTQNRLVTGLDYEYFISRNYNNLVRSIRTLSNDEYINTVLKYYYSIGLNTPNEDTNVLFGQVGFSSSTNFNNVYTVCVPKNTTIVNERRGNTLNASQKQIIINDCNTRKDLTHNIVFLDPVYKAVSFGLQIAGEQECIELKDTTSLVVKRDRNAKISNTILKERIRDIFVNIFINAQLGEAIDVSRISSDILNIPGVRSLSTRRTDIQYEIQGVSFVVWNPLYPDSDIAFIRQNFTLERFMYPFFYDITKITSNIIVEDE